MDNQNKNLILAVALSMLVILAWSFFFPPPEPTPEQIAETAPNSQTATGDTASVPTAATGTDAPTAATAQPTVNAPRINVESSVVEGTISLLGGRIDELKLKNYRQDLKEGSDIVQLLKPTSEDGAYYALYGWAPGAGLSTELVPGPNTIWEIESGETLTPDSPITLKWQNGAGLVFRREVGLDENFMFSVKQSVQNNGTGTVSLAPYGTIARHGEPADLKNFFILHEGAIRHVGGELTETDYDDFESARNHEEYPVGEKGWAGFTDHYWMTTLIVDQPDAEISAFKDTSRNIFQTTAKHKTETLAPGQSAEVSSRLFAGAKEWETIRNYQDDSGVPKFLDSIDWGWFFFITKPMFWLLHHLHAFLGNMGWAIIGLTFIIKLLLFPLAYKSYASMAKMKELQPQMEKIKEQAGDDRQKVQQEMMALYKKEKVNPAAGCLPILLQIPIFFSLYKVIFVTLELRHAPWIGWIKDLSAPDTSSIFNLFGIFPWAAPEPGTIMALVFIGILPLLLGITMWLQQKLNPAPSDPIQQQIFGWMPWVFMFMLGSFASGLVIYWIANNTITFTQQYLIMRSHGYKPDVFGNIRSGFKRVSKDKE
ncbi:membrane protein insertase YidC [Lentibacter sp. XHP0401]|jgi:YidC/Oxa1 family membrane protein insertase|uniref:membrane protein insertase YidC n=1 Tax=Lentibacter sp. XHP0401 TaxID=2984334 RepID=UPI0021E9921D|nr:membrane protein insertase YidC [Lentibacter sp. XHP0401]MCV2892848.1 membrane protein insertase YidC [Lentibacter sp. XHP0401]